MATKDDLIIGKIDDLKDSTEKRLDVVDVRLGDMNDNLADHMEQTMLVRIQNSEIVKSNLILSELHKDNQIRIESLEKPKNALIFIKDVALYIAAIAGAVLTILKIKG